MSGLFFFSVIAAWGAVAFLVAKRVTRVVQPRFLGVGLGAVAFVLMMVLPVADEIIGGYQFRALCRENAVLRIDAETAKGRTVRIAYEPLNMAMSGTAITIRHTRLSFRDVGNGQEVAWYDEYGAEGGWLIRMLGLWQGNHPLLMNSAGCSPPLGAHGMAKAYEFTLID